jgi:hypothetical protein
MRTKVIFFMAFFAFASLTMNAQTAVTISDVKAPVQDNRVEITVDQLPEPVLKTLKTDAYKDWSISKAYHIKGAGEKDMQKEHYEVVLKLNDRETTLKLDKDGNVIE